eukprot:9210694-Pyramimonas_sp.AAC.1
MSLRLTNLTQNVKLSARQSFSVVEVERGDVDGGELGRWTVASTALPGTRSPASTPAPTAWCSPSQALASTATPPSAPPPSPGVAAEKILFHSCLTSQLLASLRPSLRKWRSCTATTRADVICNRSSIERQLA